MSEKPTLRIALLEDNHEQAARVSRWIEATGYYCGVFYTAEEFQRGFRKSSFDVVVLDWMLQGGSTGLDILQWIRQTLVSDIPVIFGLKPRYWNVRRMSLIPLSGR